MAIHSSRVSCAVYYVEPIGAHAGMFYYDSALCGELALQSAHEIIWATCTETTKAPPGVRLWPVFDGIYGGQPGWLRGLRYLRGLQRVLQHYRQRGGPAILHLHFFTVPPADYLLVRLFRQLGGHVVITAHDVTPFDAGRLTTMWMKGIYASADRVVVHAEQNRHELIGAFDCPAERVRVIPHGNYTPFASNPMRPVEARERLGLERFGRIVLFFGSIKRVKGLDVLLRAMPEIVRAHPDAGLVVAGRVWKDDFSAYDQLVRQLGLGDNVECRLRFIPEDEAPLYFEAADVVALPYRKIYQSGVLLMAMSFCRPVVATRCGGMAEVVQDGVTGYLVSPEDPLILAQRINALLKDPAQAERMAMQAQSYVEQHFGWPAVARSTLSVYDELLAACRGAR